jgi:hypothetical protein
MGKVRVPGSQYGPKMCSISLKVQLSLGKINTKILNNKLSFLLSSSQGFCLGLLLLLLLPPLVATAITTAAILLFLLLLAIDDQPPK